MTVGKQPEADSTLENDKCYLVNDDSWSTTTEINLVHQPVQRSTQRTTSDDRSANNRDFHRLLLIVVKTFAVFVVILE